MDRADTGHRYLTARAGPGWKRFLLTGRSPSAYLVAACIILGAVALRSALEALVPGMPRFMVLFPAIVFVGLFCGTAAGAVSAAIGAVLADYLWLPPTLSLALSDEGASRLAVFASASAMLLWMTHTLRHALLEAESARAMLDTALAHGDVGAWEIDPASRLVRASASTHAMFGLPYDGRPIPLEDWLARLAPEQAGPVRDALVKAAAEGGSVHAEFQLQQADGSTRWIESRGGAVQGGGMIRLLGVAIDVTDRVLAERARADSEHQLKQALEAREVTVREADHRIKNSLQLVVSLLHLQRRRLVDPEAAEAIGSAISRVEAVARSHLALQQSKDLLTIDFGAALRDLCANLGRLNPAVTIRCGFEEYLPLDAERAIPLALVVSELVTNALRHAYPGSNGSATVDAITSGDVLMVTVSDQGAGHDPEVSGKGLGWTVVQSLTRKIGAELEVRSAPGEGTSCTLRLRGGGGAAGDSEKQGQGAALDPLGP